MMKLVVAVLSVVALTACASPEEVAGRHDAECRALGAEPGSARYQDCRLAKEQMHRDATALFWGHMLTKKSTSCYGSTTGTFSSMTCY